LVDYFDLEFIRNEDEFHNNVEIKNEFIKKLDTFNLRMEIKEDNFKRVFKAPKRNYYQNLYLVEYDWFLIEGNYSTLDKSNSQIYLDYMAESRNEGELEPSIPFKLESIHIVDESVKSRLSQYFDFEDLHYKADPKIDRYPKDKEYYIVVYNVGQGLCAAVCDSKLKPVLYLDFGGGEGRDSITYPLGSINLDVSNKQPIILSHWHRDHWVSIRYFKDAYNCRWVVPKQRLSPESYKLAVELCDAGNLYVINSDYHIDNIGTIFIANGRDIHWHNNGLGFLAQLNKLDEEGNEVILRYLLPGDNRYEYIANRYFDDLDWLVATHHGGVYFEGKLNCPNSIPTNTKKGKIVYSYGKHMKFFPYNNSHKHPSFIQDYVKAGWNEELNTPDGTQILL